MKRELDYEKCKKLMTNRWLEFCMHMASKDDDKIIADVVSSVAASEGELYITPVLDKTLCFKYRGFTFEVTPCIFPRGTFSDRYVVWLIGHKDVDGITLEQHLKQNPDETEQDNSFVPKFYLVPDAWSWGASFDCFQGREVEPFILNAIDDFIQIVGEDNL